MHDQMRNNGSQKRGGEKELCVHTLKEVGACTSISIFLVQSPVVFLGNFVIISRYLEV